RPSDRDALTRRTAQRDPANDAVFFRNLLRIEKLTELFGLGVSRNSCGQPYSEPERTGELNTCSGSCPRSTSAMKIVPIWCCTIETDLQNDPIAWQRSQGVCALPQCSVGQYSRRSGFSASDQNLADIVEQKRLASGDEDLLHAELLRFASDLL